MKKISSVTTLTLAAALFTSAGLAAPAAMQIINNTGYYTNAYVHNSAGQPISPHNFASIPWSTVTTLCHGSKPTVGDADPCAFEVYVSDDPSVPQQIDLATVTFYVSNGDVVNINYVTHIQKMKITSSRPGQFTLNGPQVVLK